MTQSQLAERPPILRGTIIRWEASDDLAPVQSFAREAAPRLPVEDAEISFQVKFSVRP